MRRYVGFLFVAGGLAVAAPAGATPATPRDDAPTAARAAAAPAIAVQEARVPLPGLRDEAAMVLVGTALIGIAAAVRRAA